MINQEQQQQQRIEQIVVVDQIEQNMGGSMQEGDYLRAKIHGDAGKDQESKSTSADKLSIYGKASIRYKFKSISQLAQKILIVLIAVFILIILSYTLSKKHSISNSQNSVKYNTQQTSSSANSSIIQNSNIKDNSVFKIAQQQKNQQITITVRHDVSEEPAMPTVPIKVDIPIQSQTVKSALPKILWIQTNQYLQNEPLLSAMMAQHLLLIANKSGFEARIVNNLNAYEWLSPDMSQLIRSTMHRRKFDNNVKQLLRIALLIEQGGISIRLPDTIVLQDFNWILQIFEQQNVLENHTSHCSLKSAPEIFMFHRQQPPSIWYTDAFIASTKNSTLLHDIFKQMCDTLVNQTFRYAQLVDIKRLNIDTNVISLSWFFESVLNHKLRYQSPGKQNKEICQEYGLQSIQSVRANQDTIIGQGCINLIFEHRNNFIQKCPVKYVYVFEGAEDRMKSQIIKVMNQGNLNSLDKNSIFVNDIILAQGNKWIVNPLNPQRQVHLCIISLQIIPFQNYQRQIQVSLGRIKQQNFKKWNAVYMVDDLKSETQAYQSQSQVTLVNASPQQGLNLQTAVTKHCPSKSIAFLLDYNQVLSSSSDLSRIAESVAQRYVYGGFINLEFNSQVLIPPKLTVVKRVLFEPNRRNLLTILNFFRIFNTDYYKVLPPSDLHNVQGQYFDRIIALQAMLQIPDKTGICTSNQIRYLIRQTSELMDLPQKTKFVNVTIKVVGIKQINFTRPELGYKYFYLSLCRAFQTMESANVWDPKMLIIFNSGVKYSSPNDRKQMPKLIPKKIHHIWIKGVMPEFKKYLIQKARNDHPDYEYFLWTQSNITRENFPLTYDIVTTIMSFEEKSPYGKMAMVADLLRYQIVYNEGGFYLDTNYYWIRNNGLQDFRTYEFIGGPEMYFRNRIARSNGIFGAPAKSARLLKLIAPASLSAINIYSHLTNKQTGPYYFRNSISPQDQSNPNILLPSMEELYPYYMWEHVKKINLCEARSQFQPDLAFVQRGKGYYKDCDRRYPYAYGLDLFDFGKSWGRKMPHYQFNQIPRPLLNHRN